MKQLILLKMITDLLYKLRKEFRMKQNYIEELKQELSNIYSKNNIYFKYLNNIDYYKKCEKCIHCKQKSFHIHKNNLVICSNCE